VKIVESVSAGLARFEQVKRFALLPAALTVEDGTLTPTLKVKRHVVEQRLSHVLDRLYR